MLSMSQEEFSASFRDSPIKRAKLAGMQRNACVAHGATSEMREQRPPWEKCCWKAAPRLGLTPPGRWAALEIGRSAERFLEEAALNEDDPMVREEIEAARSDMGARQTEQ